ncbi:MAG: hypothetical protein U0R44_01050 [Candidatus Micrarchaeia archaeon]
MPRAIDHSVGTFVCSRCGNRTTIHVDADNYEKTASELDQRFHSHSQKTRVQAAADAPVEMTTKKKTSAKKKAKAVRVTKKPSRSRKR